jgi:hypothetical protein
VHLEGYCRRATKAGRAEALFLTIHPELRGTSVAEKGRSRFGCAVMNPLTMPFWRRVSKLYERRRRFDRLFAAVYSYHYRRGFREAMRAERTK